MNSVIAAIIAAAPWVRATKNVKKPLGKKSISFRRVKLSVGVQVFFFFNL